MSSNSWYLTNLLGQTLGIWGEAEQVSTGQLCRTVAALPRLAGSKLNHLDPTNADLGDLLLEQGQTNAAPPEALAFHHGAIFRHSGMWFELPMQQATVFSDRKQPLQQKCNLWHVTSTRRNNYGCLAFGWRWFRHQNINSFLMRVLPHAIFIQSLTSGSTHVIWTCTSDHCVACISQKT